MSNTYIEKVVTWRHGENTLYAGTPVDDNARPANNENAIGVVAEDLNHPNKTARLLIAGEWDEDLYRGHIVLRNRAKRAMKDITFRHPAIPNDKKVTNLTDDADLVFNNVVDVVGIPTYVDDVTDYPEYALTETGWYVFSRILARGNDQVTAETTVEGAAGYIATVGNDYIDVAVRFGVTAMSQKVVIKWSAVEDTYVFKATDLAIRNLDYRTTFYVYDAARFVTWTFGENTDNAFVANKQYFLLSGSEYVPAEVTAGNPAIYYEAVEGSDPVTYAKTADTSFQAGKTYYTTSDGTTYTAATVTEGDPILAYYMHTKVTIEGLARNITYRLDDIVDCPMEFILPEIEDENHGCWFEIRCQHAGEYSMTLVPPSADVKIATEHTQKETAGINMIDLHYTFINGVKLWRFMNTHSSIPADAAASTSDENA